MKFSELGLAEPFLRAIASLGYEQATPIQAQAIPAVLAGSDLVGCAQTGTGKTAAFTLPMLDRLLQTLPPKPANPKPKNQRRKGQKGAHPRPRALRALVLSPTRELAAQIGESFQKYGKHTPLRHCVVFGGVSQSHQVRALRHGVDLLVATPGRLLDLMGQGYIDLSKIDMLVLDEADQMLDMGFLPDLQKIIAKAPEQRQTLMFSATMPPAIRRLADQWLSEPKSIEVAPVATPADRITQRVHLVDKQRKPDLLCHFLQNTPYSRTLVFSRTKHGTDKLVKRLNRDGMSAVAIHGDKSQGARNRALARFKSNKPPVLVATDIAARGLDIRDVSHVVNYDMPESPETYVHRIGRTARAGAEGIAVSFCARDEHGYLKQIERLTKSTIEVAEPIAGFELTEPFSRPKKPAKRSNRRPRRPGTKPGTETGGKKSGPKKARPSKGKGLGKAHTKASAQGKASESSKPKKKRRRKTTAT